MLEFFILQTLIGSRNVKSEKDRNGPVEVEVSIALPPSFLLWRLLLSIKIEITDFSCDIVFKLSDLKDYYYTRMYLSPSPSPHPNALNAICYRLGNAFYF